MTTSPATAMDESDQRSSTSGMRRATAGAQSTGSVPPVRADLVVELPHEFEAFGEGRRIDLDVRRAVYEARLGGKRRMERV